MTYRNNNKIEQTRSNFLVLLSFIGLPFCIYSKKQRRRLRGRRCSSLPCILSAEPQLQSSSYPLSLPSLSLQVEYYSHLLSHHPPLPSPSCLPASSQVHFFHFCSTLCRVCLPVATTFKCETRWTVFMSATKL